MAKVGKTPRAYGVFGNGARPLETDSLLAAGLVVVSDVGPDGKVTTETVLAQEDVPASWNQPQQRPPRPCGACRNDAWRPDRGTGLGWVCGVCHP